MRKTIKRNPNYEIDTNGRVYDKRTGKKVKEEYNICGYSYVMLDGRMHTVAYLMKAAFFPNDHNLCVKHIDGNRRNNRLDNLTTIYEGGDGKILVLEADKDTNEIVKIWVSAKECQRHYQLKSIQSRVKAHTPLPNGNYIEIYNSGIDGVGLFDYTDGKHKVKALSFDGVNGVYDTIKQASEMTGQSQIAITAILNNEYSSVNGYYFKWVISTTPKEDDVRKKKPRIQKEKVSIPKASKKLKKVSQYTLNGQLIRTYESVKAASDATGIATSSISSCMHHRIRQAGGFVWTIASDRLTVDIVESKRKQIAIARCTKDDKGKLIVIESWGTLRSASDATGIPQTTLKYIVRNRKDKPAKDGYYYIEQK